MFRPDKDNLNAFTVVDQVELSIDEAGQYTVDIENTPNPQWAGKVTHIGFNQQRQAFSTAVW